MTLNSLFSEYKDGKKGSEKRLFEYLAARFRIIATHRIWNEPDVEEVTQDALLSVFKEHYKLGADANFKSWAYKVLENTISNYIRTKGRRRRIFERLKSSSKNPTSGSNNLSPEFERELIDCLEKINLINNRYFQILNLHYRGYTTDEICKKLGLTQSNLYSVLFRARLLLKKCLKDGVI